MEFLASATAGMLDRNQVSGLLSLRLGEGTVAYYPGNVQQALEVTGCVYYRSVTQLMGSWELDASLRESVHRTTGPQCLGKSFLSFFFL